MLSGENDQGLVARDFVVVFFFVFFFWFGAFGAFVGELLVLSQAVAVAVVGDGIASAPLRPSSSSSEEEEEEGDNPEKVGRTPSGKDRVVAFAVGGAAALLGRSATTDRVSL